MPEMLILRRKTPQPPSSEIRKKLYNADGKHVGVAIAYKIDGAIRIGWSVCNRKDKYNKQMADKIARGRAAECSAVVPPKFVLDQLAQFATRAEKYFTNPNPKQREKA